MKPAVHKPLRRRLAWCVGGCLALGAWCLTGCGPKRPAAPPPKAAPTNAPPKLTNVVKFDSNRFLGHFTDGRSTTGRDPFFPMSERDRPRATSTNLVGQPLSAASAPTNWMLTAIVIDSEGREARINGVKMGEGATNRLKYAGGTALVECLEITATQVVIRVEGKRIVIPWRRGMR